MYRKYIKTNGIYLSSFNDYALTVEQALHVVDVLKEKNIPLLGGDILVKKADQIVYAYQKWGEKYHVLNWYIEKERNESQSDFCNRSYSEGIKAMQKAERVSFNHYDTCLVMLVLDD